MALQKDKKPLSIYFQEWESFLKSERNFSYHTVLAYLRDVRQFFSFLSSSLGKSLDDVDIEADVSIPYIRMFFSSLRRKGCCGRSIGRKLSSLRSFFRFLFSNGYISRDPVSLFKNPKVEKKLPVFLTEEQIERLLNLQYPNDFSGCRDRAIVEILYSTGLRVGELVSLNIDDLDLRAGMLRVIGKGRRERIAMVGRYAAKAVKEYLLFRERLAGDREPALFVNKFGKRLTARSVQNIIRKRMIEAGIWREGISVHTIRHSFATHLLNRGANLREVQELLGHKNLITTQIYTHLTVDKMRQVYDISHPHAH